MKNKTLILGKGFIAQRLKEELGYPISPKRINRYTDVEAVIKKQKPKTIINCIGSTGKRNVDDCELNKDKTIHSNAFVPALLAEGCLRNNIKLVHISSGCIYHYNYSYQKPISENHPPDFFDLYYSRTKMYAEDILNHLSRKYPILIVRIRIPLDNRPHPRNVLDKLIKYGKIIDIPNSITYIPDFIKTMRHLMRRNAKGIYNCTLKGGLRYIHLMKMYQKYQPNFKFKMIELKQLNLVRSNLILSTRKLEKTGFNVRRPKDILEECVRSYVKYS